MTHSNIIWDSLIALPQKTEEDFIFFNKIFKSFLPKYILEKIIQVKYENDLSHHFTTFDLKTQNWFSFTWAEMLLPNLYFEDGTEKMDKEIDNEIILTEQQILSTEDGAAMFELGKINSSSSNSLYTILVDYDETQTFWHILLNQQFQSKPWLNLYNTLKKKAILPKKKVKYEHILRDLIAISENGVTEKFTPVGYIDILTASHIIEVKTLTMWKHGLGQLQAYSCYFPDKKRRLHLFDCQKESNVMEIINVCNKLGIEVTYTLGKAYS
ncbi:MAG: hypothetical protein PUP93_31070 [Rhizonema sp. NSF051]|nr:hypothetical protein [Rhizonema sp. NSF051]